MKNVTIVNFQLPLILKRCFQTIFILHLPLNYLEIILINAAKKYTKRFKVKKKKSFIIDIGSNDGVALKPFLEMGYKNILGIEPAKNLAKLANKNKIKTFNGFLEKKNLKKIKKMQT